MTPASLKAQSSFPAVSGDAHSIHYKNIEFQDRIEFVYFSDTRTGADAFAKLLVGQEPTNIQVRRLPVGPPVDWWPEADLKRLRFQETNNYYDGVISIYIQDGPTDSEVWALKASPD